LTYLPHPYASHTTLDRIVFDKIDVIEGYNGRQEMKENLKAMKLAAKIKLPNIGGSDAHLLLEIGSVINVTKSPIETEEDVRNIIKKSEFHIKFYPTKKYLVPMKKMVTLVGKVRQKKFRDFLFTPASAIYRTALEKKILR
jgi:hypothetical protein